MRASEVAFVGALVHRFQALTPILQEHLDDYDGLLPHVFLGDFTRWLLARLARSGSGDEMVTGMLAFIEAAFARAGDDERELIAASFLENVPRPDEEGSELRELLGPALTAQLQLIG